MIRCFLPEDVEKIRELHNSYFWEEFDFPDFLNYLCAFIVEDEKGIILAGGIRDIAECMAVTDQSRAPKDRAKALYQLMNASVFTAKQLGYEQLFAWSQNPKYTRRLLRNGFRLPQGQSLILDL